MKQTPIWKIIIKIMPSRHAGPANPVRLQYCGPSFVAQYSFGRADGPVPYFSLQLLMTAIATGTGTGINILVSRMDGRGEKEAQNDTIRSGFCLWYLQFSSFAAAGILFLEATAASPPASPLSGFMQRSMPGLSSSFPWGCSWRQTVPRFCRQKEICLFHGRPNHRRSH